MKRSAIKNETEQKLRPNPVFIQRGRDEEYYSAMPLNSTRKIMALSPPTTWINLKGKRPNSKCCMIPLMWKSTRGKIIHDARKTIRAETASRGWMEKVCKGTSWVDGKVPSPVWGQNVLMSTTESEKIQKNNYTYTYIHSFLLNILYLFLLWFIPGWWVQFPVLYRRTLFFIYLPEFP